MNPEQSLEANLPIWIQTQIHIPFDPADTTDRIFPPDMCAPVWNVCTRMPLQHSLSQLERESHVKGYQWDKAGHLPRALATPPRCTDGNGERPPCCCSQVSALGHRESRRVWHTVGNVCPPVPATTHRSEVLVGRRLISHWVPFYTAATVKYTITFFNCYYEMNYHITYVTHVHPF